MIEPGVLAVLLGWIGTIIAALAYVMKTRADIQRAREESKGVVAKTEAVSDGRLTEAILTLAQNLKENSQQAGAERQQTLMAIEKSGGRVEGMMVAIVDNTKTVRDLALEIDEFGGRLQHLPQMKDDVVAIKASTATLSSLETNLEESFSEQFIPVVNALRAVEKAVQDLTKELGGRDRTIFEGLRNLEGLFREAKLEFMRRISPDVETHIPDLLPKDPPTPNGNTANPQNLPIDIHIKSAAPKETP